MLRSLLRCYKRCLWVGGVVWTQRIKRGRLLCAQMIQKRVLGGSGNWGQTTCYLKYNRVKLLNSNLLFYNPHYPIPPAIPLVPGGLERDSRS